MRVEPHAGGVLLISVTTVADVNSPDADSRTSEMFTSIDDAATAVRVFLLSLESRVDRGHGDLRADPQ